MWLFLKTLFSPDSYMPHGHCYLWQTPLVSIHVISDVLIAIAYFSIPVMLVYFVRQRQGIPFSQVFLLFGAFISLCGLGHLLDVWTLWHPAYWVSGVEQALTALVSCYTALQLVELLPQFLALRSPQELEEMNQMLQREIADRKRAEQILQGILSGTASTTGVNFFPALAQSLATSLNVRCVLISEVVNRQPAYMQLLAAWIDGQPGQLVCYPLAGTVCEAVANAAKARYYPEQVQAIFPQAEEVLASLDAESYLGVPLLDGQGQVLGVLAVTHDRPLDNPEIAQTIMTIFAARAATELQRLRAEQVIRSAVDELEQRVQERTAELVQANVQLAQEIQERMAIERMLQETVMREQEARALAEASERQFRFLAESIPQHVWTAMPDGQLDYVNQQAIDYFGSAQILGRGWQQFIHPEDLATCNKKWERAAAANSQFETEFRLRRASDQAYRWHIARALPMHDETGQIMRWFGTSTDINDQKQAEITLQKAAERERAIARITQQMRQTLDLKTIFASTTDELHHVIQCDRVLVYRFKPDWSGELVYESVAPGWQMVIPPKPDQFKLLQSAVEDASCIVKTLAGDEIVIQDTYLQETQGGVYTESGSYRCVADIYAAGFDDCYLELLELLQARAYIIVPIFLGQYLWGLLAVYQNSGPRQWKVSEVKIVTQTGNQLGVAVQQAELLAQTQQQAEDLRQAKEAADAANRAKSEFLANMSHELRTPLNAILGFAQLMAKDSTLSPNHRQYTDIINRSGEHLLKLINDILEMSKIEAGRASLNESEFDLYALLDDLEEMLSLRATAKQLTLTFDRAADVPQYICSDESKLRQVLLNLLSNAIKFTSQGYVTLRVCVVSDEVSSEGSETLGDQVIARPITLHFEVEDTGAGIAPEEMARLFEAFTQTRTGMKASEGTGLGLPISQTFVRLMGGEITVTSQVGQGSLFVFDIRATLADAALIVTRHHDRRQVIGLAPGQPTYRILIAEDIPTNRLLLARLLSPLGFEIREAENGQVALDIWRDWQPHVILMDMHMPILDGYEATRYIKASVTSHSTVIIALTASAFEEQRRAILSAGCDDFVRKPFQACELLEKLSHHLGIVYEYAEVGVDAASDLVALRTDTTSDNDRLLTAQNLTVMPPDWLDNLRHAAVLCSDVLVLQLLEQVPSEQSQIVYGLRELVESFRFDRIQSLAEQAIAQTTP